MKTFTLTVDDKGNVSSFGRGSVEQQDTAQMLAAMYLQDRAEYKQLLARCVLKNKRVNEPDDQKPSVTA